MWPFSEMSLATASLIGTIANWILLASLLGGVVSTFVIVKTSDVKEDHWAELRRLSNEKIAELQSQSSKLQRDTAEANARAAEARLELERFKLPRELSAEQLDKLTAIARKFSGTIFDTGAASTDPEQLFLLNQIVAALKNAGWALVSWQGPGQVISGGSTGIGTGLASVVGVGIYVNPDAKPELWLAVESLKAFFGETDITANAGRMAVSSNTNSATIHVMVGRKL